MTRKMDMKSSSPPHTLLTRTNAGPHLCMTTRATRFEAFFDEPSLSASDDLFSSFNLF